MLITQKLKICLISLSSVIGLSIAAPASSQPKINCTNPSSNPEYKECAYRAYEASDKKLNQVYKPILSRLKGKEQQKLIAAQSIWIKFRDANCDFEVYANRDGTGYSGFLSNCLERMTKTRIDELYFARA
jgi:uncharacterized protein YecT (DUF1311 family)